MKSDLLRFARDIYKIYRETRKSRVPLLLLGIGGACLSPNFTHWILENVLRMTLGWTPPKTLIWPGFFLILLGTSLHVIELLLSYRKNMALIRAKIDPDAAEKQGKKIVSPSLKEVIALDPKRKDLISNIGKYGGSIIGILSVVREPSEFLDLIASCMKLVTALLSSILQFFK